MHYEKTTSKNGTVLYSFRYRDSSRKLKRLHKEFSPKIENDEEAEEFCKKWNAREDAAKVRAQERLSWMSKYYKFDELLAIYTEHMKKQAPNSWQSNVFYMKHYVLDFFLNKLSLGNLELWPRHYQDFIEWLENEATLVKQTNSKSKLSYSSKNHCVVTLNGYMRYLVLKNQISHFSPCPTFKDYLMNSRGADDLVSEEEFVMIHNGLKEKDQEIADFYELLHHTGMRLNELCGIALADVFPGRITTGNIDRELERYGYKTYGHIVLTSQPKFGTPSLMRDSAGIVFRKPLKTKRTMTSKDGRVIPITDIQVFNTLVKLYKETEIQYQDRIYGNDRSNYLLFNNMTKNKLTFALKDIYNRINKRYKSPHCLRHSKSTETVNKTLSSVLAKLILGHSKAETTARYIHLYEDVVRKTKNAGAEQTIAMDYIN